MSFWLRGEDSGELHYTALSQSSSPKSPTNDRFEEKMMQAAASSAAYKRAAQTLKRLSITMLFSIVFLLLTFLIATFTMNQEGRGLLKLTPDQNDTAQLIDSYIGDVEVFLHDHPNSLADSTTFAQMGLFTRMYARMLQDHRIKEEVLDAYESSLWFFIPGVRELRRRHTYNRLSNVSFNGNKKGRGIAISVGRNTFLFANHFIATIRDVHKSQMPIEIVYRDEEDLPLFMRNYLTSTFTNVKMLGLKGTPVFDNKEVGAQGWATKAFAVVASQFSQVILADVDTILLEPPETFFEEEDYKKSGTLFFSDRNVDDYRETINDWILDQLGEKSRGPSKSLEESYFWKHVTHYRQESGVVVVDKRRAHVFASLLFTAWMNLQVIRDQVTYWLFHGDKESFWLAFELARLPYYMNNHGAGNLGSKHHLKSPDEFCGEHPLHFFEAPEGSPVLPGMEETPKPPAHQRPLSKPAWINGSLRNNKYGGGSSHKMLDPDHTIWSMDGTWYYSGQAGALCQSNYTEHGLGEFGLYDRVKSIVKAGGDAEKKAKVYLDSI
ncbi:hypothetical protein L7F22_039408 [Adiantum nelumboides]|nr:hypothetical protein [Adiantum nelumboides]